MPNKRHQEEGNGPKVLASELSIFGLFYVFPVAERKTLSFVEFKVIGSD
jgi:hypothetical protein